MKKCLLFFCAFITQQMLFAQYQTPVVDGTIGAIEYANSYNVGGSSNYYITWNATNLYVAVNFGDANNDAINLYLDINPIAVVNGGLNTNGSLNGTPYDKTTPNLPFRSDFRVFLKSGFHDYVASNGIGAWASTATTAVTKSISGSVMEFSIPWATVTGSSIPSSFNFLFYRSYDVGGTPTNTGTYGAAPVANPTLSNCNSVCDRSVVQPQYFTVSTTGDGTSTSAFSRISYATNTGTASLASASNFWDFTLNTSAATLSAACNISGVATITNGGTLTTNGNFTLKSTATNTATLADVSGIITGNITSEKFIAGGGLSTAVPSKRAFRFLAHPFNASLNLNAITGTGEIDITGTGGVTNGFTASGSNAASAFKYDAASATTNSNPGLQNGWVAYTSANGGVGNTWDQYKGLRVFYRGAKNEGLTGTAYTVGNATISMAGAVNTGNQVISLTYNTVAATGFNLVGNPYPSNVQMSGVTKANTTSSYYVWNLALGNRGGYTTVAFTAPYVLPAYASIFVEAIAAAGNVTFSESNKTTSAPSNTLLRTAITSKKLTLQLKSDDVLWDELQVQFDANAKSSKEWADGNKLQNPDVSLYSLSSDNVELAIDKRPLKDGDIINLGLLTNAARSFSF
ncbi:MAG: hypothetical protein H7178_05675, partial [Chitinophagaceae bacterium]|nr:hypothetical protein [Chitinophagaceae bacterium]